MADLSRIARRTNCLIDHGAKHVPCLSAFHVERWSAIPDVVILKRGYKSALNKSGRQGYTCIAMIYLHCEYAHASDRTRIPTHLKQEYTQRNKTGSSVQRQGHQSSVFVLRGAAPRANSGMLGIRLLLCQPERSLTKAAASTNQT